MHLSVPEEQPSELYRGAAQLPGTQRQFSLDVTTNSLLQPRRKNLPSPTCSFFLADSCADWSCPEVNQKTEIPPVKNTEDSPRYGLWLENLPLLDSLNVVVKLKSSSHVSEHTKSSKTLANS